MLLTLLHSGHGLVQTQTITHNLNSTQLNKLQSDRLAVARQVVQRFAAALN